MLPDVKQIIMQKKMLGLFLNNKFPIKYWFQCTDVILHH